MGNQAVIKVLSWNSLSVYTGVFDDLIPSSLKKRHILEKKLRHETKTFPGDSDTQKT